MNILILGQYAAIPNLMGKLRVLEKVGDICSEDLLSGMYKTLGSVAKT